MTHTQQPDNIMMESNYPAWMNTRGGYNAYYMVEVWHTLTETQQTDILEMITS